MLRAMKLVAAWVVLSWSTLALAGGDPAAGKLLSVACQACHLSANNDGPVPHLAGQRETYLVAQLHAFKQGDRKHDWMTPIATQLSDTQIADLAAYWSRQPSGGDATIPPAIAAIRKPRMLELPRDFPAGFVVYRTENSAEDHVISKSYVNATALAAAKASKPLPDGSAIVVAIYAAKLDAKGQPVIGKDGAWELGAVKSYSGMEARTGWGSDVPELLRNASWSYGLFGPDKRAKPDQNQAICLACHKPTAATSYVFTLDKVKTAR
jgi:cytochrome c553